MLHQQSFARRPAGDRSASEGEPHSTLPLALAKVGPDDPVAYALLSAFRGAISRTTASDQETRRGESEGIHRLRTSTRRLRSELRALESLLEESWHEQLQGELKWLSGLLGNVRDMDIMLARLRKAAAKRDRDGAACLALEPLFAGMESRRASAARSLGEALAGDRYRRLLAALDRASESPPLYDAAWEPCRKVLPPLADAAWRRLKKGASDLRSSAPVEEIHEVRKRAKRTRYTAELIAPILGDRANSGASRFIRHTTRIQDALGEHQDATVAARELESALADNADDLAFVATAEDLLETQHKAARDALAEFFKIWEKLDRKRLRRWMRVRTKQKVAREA
jgi:CHAD domain-containing protein